VDAVGCLRDNRELADATDASRQPQCVVPAEPAARSGDNCDPTLKPDISHSVYRSLVIGGTLTPASPREEPVSRDVRAAFVSFTEVPADQHVAFNEWHFYDHMPEQFRVDGLAWGQRWVATPDLTSLMSGTDPTLRVAQYFHVYLLTRPLRRAMREMGTLAATLTALGRWFPHRRGVLNAPFRLVKPYAAPSALIDASVVPYRPNHGVLVAMYDLPGGEAGAAARRWLDETYAPTVVGVEGVVGCWFFEALQAHEVDPGFPVGRPGRALLLTWLSDEPTDVAGRAAAALEGATERARQRSAGTPAFTAVYRSIPPTSKFDWFSQNRQTSPSDLQT
jgi:hypothetical protein